MNGKSLRCVPIYCWTIAEHEQDIKDVASQLRTCFKLLIPSQDVFDVFDDQLFSSRVTSHATGNYLLSSCQHLCCYIEKQILFRCKQNQLFS